jgi:hypothetical protein
VHDYVVMRVVVIKATDDIEQILKPLVRAFVIAAANVKEDSLWFSPDGINTWPVPGTVHDQTGRTDASAAMSPLKSGSTTTSMKVSSLRYFHAMSSILSATRGSSTKTYRELVRFGKIKGVDRRRSWRSLQSRPWRLVADSCKARGF